MKKKITIEQGRVLVFLLLILSCMLTFTLVQPFGDGPDEINRFKVVDYIYEHGTLPRGDDPEVILDGYGGSYAFQPMLTYIIDGYLLRCFSALEPSLQMRVILSRLVNVFLGCITALYVKKLSDMLFSNKKTAWAFTLAVTFLPQNLFIHTYVNTDSMGLLSIVLVVYALICGLRDDFSKQTCIRLAIGVILCALSYYNCYGIILCAILFFAMYFFRALRSPNCENSADEVFFDYKSCLKKGIFISVIVLLCIAWWFIRNAILYEGDFLALNARSLCAAQTGLEAYNPYTRDTYQRLGVPLMQMIFGTDYFTLVWKSFIAMFGPMLIPTHHYIYMAFRDLFFVAAAGLLIPMKTSLLIWAKRSQKWLVHVTMLVAMIIPIILALYYSYTFDFQPQGRYYLPMVIPFMYFLTLGMEKLISLLSFAAGKIHEKAALRTSTMLYHLLYAFLTASLLYSTFISMLGYYRHS